MNDSVESLYGEEAFEDGKALWEACASMNGSKPSQPLHKRYGLKRLSLDDSRNS